MNPYQDLNLPQLLDLMHGVVFPESVSWMLQTRGWWVFFGWLAAVSGLGVIKLVRHRRHNRYRREAIVLLGKIESTANQDPVAAATQIAVLLKRTALVAYPRVKVAQLYGPAWAQFLCESAGNDPHITQAAPLLARAAYSHDADGKALIKPARRWIEVHRA